LWNGWNVHVGVSVAHALQGGQVFVLGKSCCSDQRCNGQGDGRDIFKDHLDSSSRKKGNIACNDVSDSLGNQKTKNPSD
jgi:hypothetical protein